MSPENEYGITLISLDEEYRQWMEPGAAPYRERLDSLKALHDVGCKTWVSIEPYPTPNLVEQSLQELLSAVSFVDRIIFGRTNYNKEVSSYRSHREFYNKCADKVIQFCKEEQIAFHIKDGTITEE